MKTFHIHCLQHVDFEGPAAIADWAEQQGHLFSTTHLYKGEVLPALDEFDLLVVMGGPMSYDDDAKYPWMAKEKAFIKSAVQSGKPMVGICLGAQFIAIAAGAKGKHGEEQEVGWFPINFFDHHTLLPHTPSTCTVFHWHGDTFSIPQGALHFAGTDTFHNQGFILNDKIIGLQFHLEVTPASVKSMTEHVGHLIPIQRFTQSPKAIIDNDRHYALNNSYMFKIMDHLASKA